MTGRTLLKDHCRHESSVIHKRAHPGRTTLPESLTGSSPCSSPSIVITAGRRRMRGERESTPYGVTSGRATCHDTPCGRRGDSCQYTQGPGKLPTLHNRERQGPQEGRSVLVPSHSQHGIRVHLHEARAARHGDTRFRPARGAAARQQAGPDNKHGRGRIPRVTLPAQDQPPPVFAPAEKVAPDPLQIPVPVGTQPSSRSSALMARRP